MLQALGMVTALRAAEPDVLQHDEIVLYAAQVLQFIKRPLAAYNLV